MPSINLPNIDITEDNLKSEETMKQLVDTLFKYKKELNYLLMNLDEENMPSIIKRVSKTEEDTEGLVTRVSVAELAITPEAITSIVESNTTELAKKSDIPDAVDTSLLATKSEVTQTAEDIIINFTELQDMYGQDITIESGVIRFNKDGIRVAHSGTNQYSDIRADGFVRKWPNGEAKYLNDIHTVQAYSILVNQSTRPAIVWIPLPASFTGRSNTKVFAIPNDIYFGKVGEVTSNELFKMPISQDIICRVNTRDYTINWNANPVQIPILAYTKTTARDSRTLANFVYFDSLEFVLIAIGV